jgi:hypothetical protein
MIIATRVFDLEERGAFAEATLQVLQAYFHLSRNADAAPFPAGFLRSGFRFRKQTRRTWTPLTRPQLDECGRVSQIVTVRLGPPKAEAIQAPRGSSGSGGNGWPSLARPWRKTTTPPGPPGEARRDPVNPLIRMGRSFLPPFLAFAPAKKVLCALFKAGRLPR